MTRPITLALLGLAAAGLVACGSDGETTVTVEGDGGSDGGPAQVISDSNGFSPQEIYAESSPGIVTIESFFGEGGILGAASAGQGSGFVVSENGEIATNAHVVTQGGTGNGGGNPKQAEQVFVEFADRNRVEAEVLGFDPYSDVAVIKVDPDGLDLQPLTLGTSADAEVGQPVAAIGSPFGQDRSISIGIISATDRSIESLTNFRIDGAIQTDASINPGNSGGPLLDIDGEVIGINQQINTTSGGNEGVGFALPIDLAKRSIEQIGADGEVSYAFIGVETTPLWPQLADRLELDTDIGAMIAVITDGGPADKAGLRGGDEDSPIEFQGREIVVGGDIIVAVDGEKLRTPSDLASLIALREPGEKVEVEIIRDGKTEKIDVELGARDLRS